MRCSGRARLRTRPRSEDQWRLTGAGIHKTDSDAAVPFRQDLRRHIAAHQFESRGQDHAVTFNAQRAVENNRIAIAVVTLGIPVGFDDEKAALSFRRNGPRELHLDVVPRGVSIDHQRILARLRARNNFKTEWLTGHGVVNSFVAGSAALSNGIEVHLGSCRRCRHFVENLETCSLGRKQLVPGVLVGLRLPRGRRRRIDSMLLCAESSAAENHREHCDERRERPGHTFNLLADRKSGFCPCMIADSRDRVNRQNSPPGLEEIPTRLSQRFAPSRGIGIGCRLKLDAALFPSTSCATLFISCAPSPRLTTTGWAARAPSPPLCSNRTATARSSTRARVPRSKPCASGYRHMASPWAISTPSSSRTSTWITPGPQARWCTKIPGSLYTSTKMAPRTWPIRQN